MKECLLILVLVNFSSLALADEVKDKTDPSFVGEHPQKPINSSFVGDISNSMADDYGREEVKEKTETPFVGTNEIRQEGSFLAGSDFDRQMRENSNTAFAGESTKDDGSYGRQ